MRPPRFDPDRLTPLVTEQEIEARVLELIGRASRRQLWFLFVDEGGHQLPVLLPIEEHPSLPDEDDAERFAILLSGVREASDARGVIVVIERYADAAPSRSDLAWARAMRDAAAESPVDLRAVVVSHRTGVRLVPSDDYLPGDARRNSRSGT